MDDSPRQRTHNRSYLKDYRWELRTFGTSAEAAAWNLLKGKRIEELQFRRQFSIEDFILDFYCPALRLAIELDGESHNEWGKCGKDRNRDTILRERHGITVLRYENKIVYQHPEYIIEDIKKAKREGMDTRPLQPQAAATPSNLEGEKKTPRQPSPPLS